MTDSSTPVDLKQWRSLPCQKGKRATRLDSEEGRAAFFIPRAVEDAAELATKGNIEEDVEPILIDIPSCALLHSDEGEIPVIVIQAERTRHNGVESELAGYRSLAGGIGVCMFHELEIIGEPDQRFLARLSAT